MQLLYLCQWQHSVFYLKRSNRVRRNLEMDFMILHQWFHENHMTLNPGKCHYMIIGSKDLSHMIMLNNNEITSSSEEKLLGILLDTKLNFESHIGSLGRKADQKINILAKLKNLTSDQRNLQLNSVIKYQFIYCSLICIFTLYYIYVIYIRHTMIYTSYYFNSILTKTIQKLFIKNSWISRSSILQISKWLASVDHEWYFHLKTKHF